MQEAFEKLKGVNIFSLKSYMEPTGFGSFNGVWVMINEIFVNFFFFILNAVVGFFSLLIKLLENIDLYSTYKTYVYNGANNIWKGFTGSATGGIYKGSLVSILLVALGIYLFYQYFFTKGNFMRTVLHVLMVIMLGFSYFGTIANTSGGLYLLDTVNNLAKTASDKISDVKISYSDKDSVKIGQSLTDSYIAETSYKAYVFVNTGQENGKYKNSQDGKEETFDDEKVLGKSSGGKFTEVKAKERSKYLDELGDGANDDGEKNRWVSAMPDFIFTRVFYVIFKIVEAFVLAIPIILIQMLNVLAQILVLMMILLFPIVLLVSFIPRMQDLIFGVVKVMFGGLSFPAIASLLTLLVFYIERLIEGIVTTGFDGVLKSLPSLVLFGLIFKLLVSVVSKTVIYILLWKYKAELISFILGSKARMMTQDIGNKVEAGAKQSKEIISQAPSKTFAGAQHLGNFALAGAGFGAGMLMNAKSQFQNAGNFFTSRSSTPTTEESPLEPPNEIPSTPKETPQPEIKPTSKTPEKPSPSQLKDYSGDDLKPSSGFEPPLAGDIPPSEPESEFETLKQDWISPLNKLRIHSLEKKLEVYKDPEAMYKAQGSNSFTRNYRKTLTREDKLRSNIERRDRLTERLNQLRGG